MPTREPRRRPTFFTSPYQCEYCGASNDIDESGNSFTNFSSDSECPSVVETVNDVIRRGNPAHVIDHRTFPKTTEKSEKNISENPSRKEDEEMDILWRDDANEYFEQVDKLEDEMEDLILTEGVQPDKKTVFITEASVPLENNRRVHVKMAWDDESNDHFAEISRTITRDDGLEETDFQRTEATRTGISDRYNRKLGMGDGACLFQENDSVTGMKVRIHGRTLHDVSTNSTSNDSNDSFAEQVSILRNNIHVGGGQEGTSGSETLRVSRIMNSCGTNTNYDEASNSENDMARSPIANLSVRLSRVALMRLSRHNRSRSRHSLSLLGGGHEKTGGTQVGLKTTTRGQFEKVKNKTQTENCHLVI